MSEEDRKFLKKSRTSMWKDALQREKESLYGILNDQYADERAPQRRQAYAVELLGMVLDNGSIQLLQQGFQLSELPKAPCTKCVYATKLKARLSRSVSDQLQACLWSWANYLSLRKGKPACWWSHVSHHHFMRTEQCEPSEMKFQPKTCERNMRKHYNNEYAHHS